MFFKKWFKRKEDWEKAGFHSKESYERYIDPDISHRTSTIAQFYHGYSYYFPVQAEGFRDYGMLGVLPYNDQIHMINDWCDSNCKGKWRGDWHRGFFTEDGFEFNSLGSTDLYFFAFQDEQDSIMFKLRW